MDLIADCPEADLIDESGLAVELDRKAGAGYSAGPQRTQIKRTEAARTLARAWLSQGVFVLKTEQFRWNFPSPDAAPPLFFAWGNSTLLDRPRAAVLNSRKPRPIRPDDRWLLATKSLTRQAMAEGYTVLAGVGLNHYELVAFLAAEAEHPLVIVCDDLLPRMRPGNVGGEFFDQFRSLVQSPRVLWLSPFSPGRLPPKNQRRPWRDACLAALADKIFAVEIRSGGHMEKLIGQALKNRTPAAVFHPRRFDRATAGNEKLLEQGALSRPEDQVLTAAPQAGKTGQALDLSSRADLRRPDLENESYLFHFTRACPGPWPGQDLRDYYRALVRGRPDAGHTAFDTLRRILDEGVIRAGSRLIRGSRPVVSFTACGLDELAGLVRWNPALIRWTLEPYGLALPRRTLMELGAAPVLYGGDDFWAELPPEKRFRFQLHRPPKTDWSGEKEWRLAGDLGLRAFGKDRIKVIVPRKDEAEEIAAVYGLETISAGGVPEKYPKRAG